MFFLDTSSDDALPLVERLRDAIRNADFKRDGKRVPLSISFGLAAVPNTRYPLSHALAAAEVACKAAERSRPRPGRALSRRRPAASCVVMKTRRFSARCEKPSSTIVSGWMRSPSSTMGDAGQPRRFELLLRMIDSSGERVTPDKFLSAAERYQLTTDIDRWVVQYALEVLSSAAPALLRLDAHFAINISGQSLGDEDFTVISGAASARICIAAAAAVVRDHRDRRGCEYRAGGAIDPPLAGSRARHRAGRLRQEGCRR